MRIAFWLAIFATVVIVLTFVRPADAHMAQSGWTYGWECCSGRDCEELPNGSVLPTPEGWSVERIGEVIPYSDGRLKESKDSQFHLCTYQYGKKKGDVRCLYVPRFGV